MIPATGWRPSSIALSRNLGVSLMVFGAQPNAAW